MYANYDDTEIGALDCEEIEGHVAESSDLLLQYANDFENLQKTEQLDKEIIKQKTIEGEDSASEGEFDYIPVKEKEKWDCESILSTYSNIYNHPKLITEPRVSIQVI